MRWRERKERSPGAERIVFPEGVDARCGIKRQILWDGYTVSAGATCSVGATSICWIDTAIRGEPRIHIDFAADDCSTCPVKPQCTGAPYRSLTLPPREEWDILQQRRAEQNTDTWKDRYQTRAGVEGSIS